MLEAIKYIIAQVAGAIVAAAVLWVIATGKAGYTLAEKGLGQNGWGAGYLGEYSMIAALVFEIVATFLFMVVIHLVGINVTGVSVNPARSVGPALFVGGTAIAQLWLFIVAPILGAVAAGLLFKTGTLDAAE